MWRSHADAPAQGGNVRELKPRKQNKPPGPSSWKESKLKPHWGGAGIRRCYSPASFKQGQDHHPLLHQVHQRATEERVEGTGNHRGRVCNDLLLHPPTILSSLLTEGGRKAGWSSLVKRNKQHSMIFICESFSGLWLHLNSYFIISLEYFKVHLCICAHIFIMCRIWTQTQEWR